jgi:glutamyl-tRNA reductase
MESIGLVGITFRQHGADAVARFTVAREQRREVVARMKEALDVAELVYLATCNRVEVAYRERGARRAVDRRRQVFRALIGHEPEAGEAERTLRGWLGEGAVEHLFVVAAGLDSAQVGEREIQGQLRDALTTAREAGAAGALLDRLTEESLRVAHQVHRQTHLGDGRLSLAEIAADHLLERIRRTPGAVALVGVSPMTRRCAEALERETTSFVVVNRHFEKAAEMAAAFPGSEAMDLESFRSRPPRVEALLTATGSPEAVLDRACLERLAARTESGEPPLVVDLAVPADVEPEAAASAGVPRLGMDEINAEAEVQRVQRRAESAAARDLVDHALEDLRHRMAERVLAPVIAKINQRYRQTALEGLERLLSKKGVELDAETREAIERWAETLARRFAHLPTLGLRGLASELGVSAVGSFLSAGDDELYREFHQIETEIDRLADSAGIEVTP